MGCKWAAAWCCLVVLLASRAVAAEAADHTVQIDPLTTALGFAHVQVERVIAPQWSFYAGPHVRAFPSLWGNEQLPMRGAGIELGLRRFWRPSAPNGWWTQVRGVAAYTWRTDSEQTGLGYSASALVGYTAIFSGRWVLAGGLGVNYLRYGPPGARIGGVLPAAHTTIGVAF